MVCWLIYAALFQVSPPPLTHTIRTFFFHQRLPGPYTAKRCLFQSTSTVPLLTPELESHRTSFARFLHLLLWFQLGEGAGGETCGWLWFSGGRGYFYRAVVWLQFGMALQVYMKERERKRKKKIDFPSSLLIAACVQAVSANSICFFPVVTGLMCFLNTSQMWSLLHYIHSKDPTE